VFAQLRKDTVRPQLWLRSAPRPRAQQHSYSVTHSLFPRREPGPGLLLLRAGALRPAITDRLLRKRVKNRGPTPFVSFCSESASFHLPVRFPKVRLYGAVRREGILKSKQYSCNHGWILIGTEKPASRGLLPLGFVLIGIHPWFTTAATAEGCAPRSACIAPLVELIEPVIHGCVDGLASAAEQFGWLPPASLGKVPGRAAKGTELPRPTRRPHVPLGARWS